MARVERTYGSHIDLYALRKRIRHVMRHTLRDKHALLRKEEIITAAARSYFHLGRTPPDYHLEVVTKQFEAMLAEGDIETFYRLPLYPEKPHEDE